MAGMSSAQYLLRWNDHLNNYSDVFLSLREEEKFFDCSIACEDGVVGSHRVVLAGCSQYLRDLFLRLNNPHPIIFLVNTPRSLILLLMEFIYRGEVHIPQNRLKQLVTLGQSLKIKGLTQIAIPTGLPKHAADHNNITPMAFPQALPLSTLETLPLATGPRVSNISLQSCDAGNDGFEEDGGGGGGGGGRAGNKKVTAEMENADTPVTTPAATPTPTATSTSTTTATHILPDLTYTIEPRKHKPTFKLSGDNPYVKLTDALASGSNVGMTTTTTATQRTKTHTRKPSPSQLKYYRTRREKISIGEYAVAHGIQAAKKKVCAEYKVRIKDGTIKQFMRWYKRLNWMENKARAKKMLAKHNT